MMHRQHPYIADSIRMHYRALLRKWLRRCVDMMALVALIGVWLTRG